jgi:hypothetical protein
MDFLETRMLHHLEAQDAIIAAKTEQSEGTNRSRIDPAISSRRIDVGDYVLRKSNVTTNEDKPARKLLLPSIGPYKVPWHDATRTTYQLDLGSERAYSYFHVSQIKPYTGEPTNPQCRPRISLSVSTDNLQIVKVLGHRFKFNDGLQFLCQYQVYLVEDATYRNAIDFIEPAARLLVVKYIRNIAKLPRDLEAWLCSIPGRWIRQDGLLQRRLRLMQLLLHW